MRRQGWPPRRRDLGAACLERPFYGGGVRDVPRWGVVSSAAAPVLLVGGWTPAASLQPRFDPVAGTVSALAAEGAADRWVMTLTFVVAGVCYLLTALALRSATTAGRLVLATEAIAGMLVAANPERAGDLPVGAHYLGIDRAGGGDCLACRGLAAGQLCSMGPEARGGRRGRRGAARSVYLVRG